MKQSIFYFIGGFLVGLIASVWIKSIKEEAAYRKATTYNDVVWRQEHFVLNPENLFNELNAQGLAFPEIIVAQAILETGYFKSYSCKDYNNLFGLRKADGTYMRFDHWTDCIAAYKSFIQDWEKCPEDYYKYLDDLGYAEDSLYIQKLRKIVKTNWAK